MILGECKICGGKKLQSFKHTALCKACGILLYYPYPEEKDLEPFVTAKPERLIRWKKWYDASAWNNHWNFSHMIEFALDGKPVNESLDILDYGGGGGQFALVCKSMLPNATVHITDIDDDALLPNYAALNYKILHKDFPDNPQLFDIIFLNDVLEHVKDPLQVLSILGSKLKKNGSIFIDTPIKFWLYPMLHFMSPALYHKLCLATVNGAHLQIWSKKSFLHLVDRSGLNVTKYKEATEFTRNPSYYLDNMAVRNYFVRLAGFCFYNNAKWLAKNKILAVLKHR